MVEPTMDVSEWLRKQLEEASPDLLRAMVQDFAEALRMTSSISHPLDGTWPELRGARKTWLTQYDLTQYDKSDRR